MEKYLVMEFDRLDEWWPELVEVHGLFSDFASAEKYIFSCYESLKQDPKRRCGPTLNRWDGDDATMYQDHYRHGWEISKVKEK